MLRPTPLFGNPSASAPAPGDASAIERPGNPLARTLDQAVAPPGTESARYRPAGNVMRSRLMPPAGKPPKNYGIVNARVVRSAQPKPEDLPYLQSEGVRVLFNLQQSPEKLPDTTGFECMHVPTDAHSCANDATAIRILQALVDGVLRAKELDARILVHCTHGNDRTGFAIYLFDRLIRCIPHKVAYDTMRGKKLRVGFEYGARLVGRAIPESTVTGVHNIWSNIKGYCNALNDQKIRQIRQHVAGLTQDEIVSFERLREQHPEHAVNSLEEEWRMLDDEAAFRSTAHALACGNTLSPYLASRSEPAESLECMIRQITALSMGPEVSHLRNVLLQSGICEDQVRIVTTTLRRTAREALAYGAMRDKYARLLRAANDD